MKINSVDNNSWLSIESDKDEFEHKNVSVEASIDIGHGNFHAKNIDIVLLNTQEFIDEIDKFLLDRNKTPKLCGTYDSFLEIHGDNSHIYLNFAIGDAFCGKLTHEYLFRGSFEFDQEQLLSIKQEIQRIQDL